MRRIAGFTVTLVLVATAVWAQDWRGSGRLSGKVVDEQGKPVEGVVVSASLPALQHGVLAQGKSDKKGEWTVDDVGEGNWELTFEADGYHPAKATADVDENGRSSSLKTTLKKVFDPNAFVQEEVKKANALIEQKKYAEARAVYEGIVAKVPQVGGQAQMFIAETYFREGQHDKAKQTLRTLLEKDATNVQAKIWLISYGIEDGETDEPGRLLPSVDEAKITDPAIYVNFGIAFLKKQKAVESLPYFDKAAARFPQMGETYYYRARANVDLVNAEKDPKNPERIARLGKIKEDLNKFLQLAPNSPNAGEAKKLLDEILKMTTETK